uniref:Tat pathway signal sequence n=1 Tax=Moniliophthora roreri TaxID=221103 RepID=A0A0W0FDA5_MONRR
MAPSQEAYKSEDYAPLLQNEPDVDLEPRIPRDRYSRIKDIVIVIQFIVIASTLLLVSTTSKYKSDPLLYSPVNHLLEEKVITFHSGVGNDTTKYMGEPSPELDKAWDDLYGFGINKISKHDADQLPVKTVRIPSDPDHYVVALDVYHQLHCLNLIRKAFHSDYYHKLHAGHVVHPRLSEEEHITHCIEHLRQSIICASDVSTIVWHWNSEKNMTIGRSGVPHTCKNFDKISEWANQPENRFYWRDFDLGKRRSKTRIEMGPFNQRERGKEQIGLPVEFARFFLDEYSTLIPGCASVLAI